MENLLKTGKVIDQNDINIALYKEIMKLDSKINWSIGIQISVAVATIITMFGIAGYTINMLSMVVK